MWIKNRVGYSVTFPVLRKISSSYLNSPDWKASTRWIKDLNDIRTVTMHPECGVLTTDQAAFVNELFDKVKKHFPEDIS